MIDRIKTTDQPGRGVTPLAMPLTTLEDLDRHLAELGVTAGMNILVHSRLISFGRIEGGADTVLRALAGRVGPGATIAVPTHTVYSSAGQVFDPAATPSERVGVLSEHVRCLPDARRSPCPMHSHAAIGPLAGRLAERSGKASMGPGSDFELFLEHDFTLVLLGCRFEEGATYTFHVESDVGVPYRVWLDLPRRRVGPDGVIETMTCRYYGRAAMTIAYDLERIPPVLDAAGALRRAPCPFGASFAAGLPVFHAIVGDWLRRDPEALLVRPEAADV